MSVDTFFLRTKSGDEVTINLFQHAGQEPSICITVDDVDHCRLPTIEFSMREVVKLREILRKCGEEVMLALARARAT